MLAHCELESQILMCDSIFKLLFQTETNLVTPSGMEVTQKWDFMPCIRSELYHRISVLVINLTLKKSIIYGTATLNSTFNPLTLFGQP